MAFWTRFEFYGGKDCWLVASDYICCVGDGLCNGIRVFVICPSSRFLCLFFSTSRLHTRLSKVISLCNLGAQVETFICAVDVLSIPEDFPFREPRGSWPDDDQGEVPGPARPHSSDHSRGPDYEWVPWGESNSPLDNRGSGWSLDQGSPSLISDFSTHQSHSGSVLAISRSSTTGEAAPLPAGAASGSTFGRRSASSSSSIERGPLSYSSAPIFDVSSLNLEVRVRHVHACCLAC